MIKKKIIRITSLLLCLIMLLPLVCGCTKNSDDGPKIDENDPYYFHHNDMLTIEETADDKKVYNFDPKEIGDFNYDNIIDTLVDFQTGGMNMEKASGDYLEKMTSYVKSSKTSQKNLRKVSGWDGSFEEDPTAPFQTDMTTTSGISTNYSNIYNMARAYALEGSETYHSKKLLNDIVYAMDYMHVNYYSDRTLRTYSKLDNWYDWQIGSAQRIVNILMLIRDGITKEQIDKYLEPINEYDPLPSMTMANRVDIAYVTIAASALQKDYERLVLSRDMLDQCCEYVTSGDGFYEDGSFIQHTYIPYTGSYGIIMLEALSMQIVATSNTCFRFGEYMINSQYSWAMDSFVPLMFHGAIFGLVRGRSICRSSTDVSLGLTALEGMLRMTKYVTDEDKKAQLKSIIKEYDKYNDEYYQKTLSPYDLKILDSIVSDKKVKPRTDYTFAKVFAKMDRPIAQLENYAVGISLSSSRIAKYEAINSENGKGWYTGDGMLYIYTDVNDYNSEYWKNINYYRIPGTTVTTVARIEQNASRPTLLSQYDFVGGTAFNNSMVAAMQFESATSKMDFSSTLNGKKAWFVFDNEIVCLGTDISCSDDYNTETIIENRRITSSKAFYADGKNITDTAGILTNKKSLYIDGFGGIYLPENTAVNFNIAIKDVNFLELYINHGKNIADASYSYVVLPTMTSAKVTSYASSPDIEIISNTAEYQVVKEKNTGLVGYVFWKAGTCNGVTVSAPCTLLISGNTVACTDPTMKVSNITVTTASNTYEFSGLANGQTSVIEK